MENNKEKRELNDDKLENVSGGKEMPVELMYPSCYNDNNSCGGLC